MVKTQISFEYLKKIDKIKEFLKYTNKSEKSLRTYFSAFDKFFPYLIEFYEIVDNFDLETHISKGINETNEIKKEWSNNGVVKKVIEAWLGINKEQRSRLFMKWVNEQEKDIQNTYTIYVWSAQGLLSQISEEWSANPKTMRKTESNGIHVDEDKEIDLADVGELYNKLSPKYKMILKMMMYTGLNPADLVQLKPIDFNKISNKEKYGNRVYYFVKKKRVKSERKNVIYLHVYTEEFMNEIKNYFEMEKTIKYNKTKQADKVAQLRKNSKFEVVKEYKNFIEFKGKNNWKKDEKKNIFGDIKATAVSDAFKYRNIGRAEHRVQPSTVRRLCFTRIGKIFTHDPKERDIFDLWTQHKVGVVTDHYITDLIYTTVSFLENNKIQSAVLLGNMGDYIKESITLRKKFDDIETLKEENKELKDELESMKQLNKEEMNNLWNQMKEMKDEMTSMFQDRDYNRAFYEAEISEVTENEKHSKLVKKSK